MVKALVAIGAATMLMVAAACADSGDQDSSSTRAPPIEDGVVVATEGGMDGGRIWFIWDGQRQRIEQPSGLEPEQLPQMGLEIGEPAPLRLTVGAVEGTTWHVIPPDGPDARLYISYEGVLHQVTVLEADDAQVLALPEAKELLISRVRLAGD